MKCPVPMLPTIRRSKHRFAKGSTNDGRSVALTYIDTRNGDPPYRISTVRLISIEGARVLAEAGMPSIHGDEEYETMVFLGDDSSDLDCARYPDERRARLGHEIMVRKWFDKLTPQSQEDEADP